MFWKVAGTTEIHFRILSNRRYWKSNPSRTASKNPFGKHSFEKFPWKIPVTQAVTNLQNFTLGCSQKRGIQKSRVFPKKRDPKIQGPKNFQGPKNLPGFNKQFFLREKPRPHQIRRKIETKLCSKFWITLMAPIGPK